MDIDINKFIGLDTGQSRKFKCGTKSLKESRELFAKHGFEVVRIGGSWYAVKIDETKIVQDGK